MEVFRHSATPLPELNEMLCRFENMTPELREQTWVPLTPVQIAAIREATTGTTGLRFSRLSALMQDFRKRAAALVVFNDVLSTFEDMSPASREAYWKGYSLEVLQAMASERDGVTEQRLDRLLRHMEAYRVGVSTLATVNKMLAYFESKLFSRNAEVRERYHSWTGNLSNEFDAMHAERNGTTLKRYERLQRLIMCDERNEEL
jgi:hypothetical protein